MKTCNFIEDFKPSFLLQHNLVQSAMASYNLGASKNNKIQQNRFSELIYIGYINNEPVHLQGDWSLQPSSRGLVILLHGWEGSSDSSYILRTGQMLYKNGYDIFRLNFRDHGNTHRLNKGLFNGSLLEEVHKAVHLVSKSYSRYFSSQKVYLVGFSLGGNFVIRLTHLHSNTNMPITGLHHCFAISPAIDPYDATVRMDKHLILGPYFLRKWMSSLLYKEKYYSSIYNFTTMKKARSVMELTEKVVLIYSPFHSIREYFNTYTLGETYFTKLKTPLTVLTSLYDPIISPEPFLNLKKLYQNDLLNITITKYGGHNGFYFNSKLHCLYEELIKGTLEAIDFK